MTTYNLASLLENSAERYPERVAVVDGQTRLTYRQLDNEANRVANVLVERGVRPGDKVALMSPNCAQFTINYNAILKAGAAVTPLNVLLKAREVAYHLADSDAVLLIAHQGNELLPIAETAGAAIAKLARPVDLLVHGTELRPPGLADTTNLRVLASQASASFDTVRTDEDDTAVILYTSGTTGQPKGAELRHRNMRDNALVAEVLSGQSVEDPDVFLCVLPLFHSFGQSGIQNAAAAFAGTVVMLPRFDARTALDTMISERVSNIACVPTMFWGLLNALDGEAETIAKTLRFAASGGAPLPLELHEQFRRTFGVTITEGYGLSETSPAASSTPADAPPRPGSVGLPIPGVEMKLLTPSTWDEIEWNPDAIGEVAIRGHNVFKGYYNRPEATAEVLDPDGWFRTGDLARRDEDGWYYIVDRAKELIIRGGFNVYPREIEEILMSHPAVLLVAVVGVPHETHGEEVKAYVILKPGQEATGDDIVAWAKAELASYKYPREVQIVDRLPMTATGKILKRELRNVVA